MVQFVHDNIYTNYPFLIDVKSELDVFILSSADILFEDGTCSTHLHPLVRIECTVLEALSAKEEYLQK